VFVHVVVSLGWMGAGLANVVLAMTAGYTDDVDTRQVCYLMIQQIDVFVVIPGAFTALASGLLLSVLTPWGLSRYWWVLSKLVLTIAVICYSTLGVGVWVEQSIDATSHSTAESPVAGPLAYGALLNIVAFLFMTWVSIAKPWGTTPWTSRVRTRSTASR
jgi:glucan phosphoethanolaminetransferase (alkaline phosphatase superfamily)